LDLSPPTTPPDAAAAALFSDVIIIPHAPIPSQKFKMVR
jgi:hypothetical protein